MVEIQGKIKEVVFNSYALIKIQTELLQDGVDFTLLIDEPVSLLIEAPDACLQEKKIKGCGLPF